MSQALYRKWRPHRWEDVIGQDHVIQTLRNAVTAERVAHAQLFAGPRGTGKTTTARLLAKAVNCLDDDLSARPCNRCVHCQAVNQGRFLDLIEIDAASNTSVEDVRDLRDRINFSPNQGRFKVYIIDEVHMLSTAAFNALLKTLEEPPPHAMFVLATTEPHRIPPTVLSRCQRHEFRRIPVNEIVGYLQRIVEEEGIQAEPEALTLVARQATGAMRDAISLLDQLASTGRSVTLELAQAVLGTATSQAVLEVYQAVLDQDSSAGLSCIHRALDAGSDPRQFARQVVEYLRGLLMVRMGNADQVDAPPEARKQMAEQAHRLEVSELLRILGVFNRAAVEAKSTWVPALPLEMAFIEAIEKPVPRQPEGQAPGVLFQSAITPPARSRRKAAGSGRPPAESPEDQDQPEIDRDDMEETAESQEPSTPGDPEAARRFEELWSKTLNLVRQTNPNLYALMNSAKTRRLKNGILTLGFAGDVLKPKMERSENVHQAEEVLGKVFGEPVSIRCVALSGKQTTPPPGVDTDGMVASALRDLGGEIVDIQ